MSGLIVEFNGRGFWDKRNHDIWYYHLSYLIKQSENMPQWALEWADEWLALAPQETAGFMFGGALEVLTDNARLSLMVELSHKLMERFKNYDEFLQVEKAKWIAAGRSTEYREIRLILKLPPYNHWQMISQVTHLPSVLTFGTLFIRLLTGENWKRAYFHSYAQPFFVAAIDTLSQWVSPDEIGLTHATGLTRYRGSWLFWVSPSNSDAYIEDLEYKGKRVITSVMAFLTC